MGHADSHRAAHEAFNRQDYNEVARTRLEEIGKPLKEQKKGHAEQKARGGLLLERYKHAQPQSQPGAG